MQALDPPSTPVDLDSFPNLTLNSATPPHAYDNLDSEDQVIQCPSFIYISLQIIHFSHFNSSFLDVTLSPPPRPNPRVEKRSRAAANISPGTSPQLLSFYNNILISISILTRCSRKEEVPSHTPPNLTIRRLCIPGVRGGKGQDRLAPWTEVGSDAPPLLPDLRYCKIPLLYFLSFPLLYHRLAHLIRSPSTW